MIAGALNQKFPGAGNYCVITNFGVSLTITKSPFLYRFCSLKDLKGTQENISDIETNVIRASKHLKHKLCY